MPDSPQYDPKLTRELIQNLSRGPFREFLARVMDGQPSLEAIQSLAERQPDRWGQLLALSGRMAGYTEKLEVEGTLTQRIQDLSDAELATRIAALDKQSSAHTKDDDIDTGPA